MKKTLLIIIATIFVLPLLQSTFSFIEEPPLNGNFVIETLKDLSLESYFDNTFQESFEKKINETIGFKNTLTRIYNQYCFSILNKANAYDIIIGKNNTLFQKKAIESYFGKDLISNTKAEFYVNNLLNAQIELDKKGVKLLTILAPSKPRFYLDDIPNSIKKQTKSNNYSLISKKIKDTKEINYLDFIDFFKNRKNDYPVFPKNGMHWSGYASVLAFEQIILKLEKLFKKDLNGFYFNEGILTDKNLKYSDNDIAKTLNLLIDPHSNKLFYPNIIFKKKSDFKPNVLIVGDSFAQAFYGFYPFYTNIFGSETELWFYYRAKQWPIKNNESTSLSNINKTERILSMDCLILIINEDNLYNFGFGLFEDLSYIIEGKLSPRESEVKKIVERIKNDKEWYNRIVIQSKDRNQTVEETLIQAANYIYNSKNAD